MWEQFQNFDAYDWLAMVVLPLTAVVCWLFCTSVVALRYRVLLPRRTQNEVPWGAIDVFCLVGLMMFMRVVSQLVAMAIISSIAGVPLKEIDRELAIEYASILSACNTGALLLHLAIAFFWLRLRQGATLSDLGYTRSTFKADLATGIVASMVLIPISLMVNVAVHTYLKIEYSHDVLDMVKHSIWMTGVSTVLIAPLSEEFQFRVLIQGWLQRLQQFTTKRKLQMIHGDRGAALLEGKKDTKETQNVPPNAKTPYWPILASAIVFASMHVGQGAAPYALFVFAIGLGILYRQTSSIVPCLVVHLLLNLWSFSALILQQF